MADSKRAHFSKSPILKIFSQKFHALVLGFLELIDSKDIALMCFNLYGRENIRYKLKKGQKNKKHFLLVLELVSLTAT